MTSWQAKLRLKPYKTPNEKLILANLKNIYYWVNRYVKWGLDADDLTQEAIIGLLEAVKSYVPEKGKFWHWAQGYVRHRLYKYFKNNIHMENIEFTDMADNAESALDQLIHEKDMIEVTKLIYQYQNSNQGERIKMTHKYKFTPKITDQIKRIKLL